MIIGPFNSFHIEELKTLLQQRSIPFNIIQDPQALEKIRETYKERGPTQHYNLRSTGDFLYLDVDPEDIKQIMPYLEKFGMTAGNSEEDAHKLESAEYHCVKCDFVSDHPGVCTIHKEALLEYSDWMAAGTQRSGFGPKGQFIVFVLVVGGIAVSMILRMLRVF